MIAALRRASAARRRRRVSRSGSAGGGEDQADQALAAFGRVDGVVAGEPADLLQRRPGARARRRAPRRRRRAIQPTAPSRASMRRGLRAAGEVVEQRAGLGEELDVHHPAGAELHLPGVGGGGLVRLGEAAAHVGGVGEDAGRRRAAGRGPRRSRRRPASPRCGGAGDDAGAGQRQVLPGPGLLGLVAAEGGERGGDRALSGRRGAGACRPCRGCPRRSGRRGRRSAPG